MKQIISLLAIATLLISSCKKDEDHSRDVTKENIAGTYRMTAATFQTGSGTPEDYYALMTACEKDDSFRFNANGTYDYIDAGTQCTPPGDDKGTWALPSTTQLAIDVYTYTIKSFDGRTLVLSISETSGSTTYTYTQTLVKQ